MSDAASELDFTALVTCFNEEEHIVGALEHLVSALEEFHFSWEIVVIDDASEDRSVELVREFQRSHPDLPIHLYCNEANQGFGYAYVQGAFLGRGEYYRVFCGDDPEPRETLVEVLKHLGQVDLVIPYYVNDTGRSRFRKFLSSTYTRLVNALTGHSLRYYNGLPILRRNDMMRWHSNYRGLGIQADVLARLLDEGCSYVEVGVWDFEKKHGGSTALHLKNVASVAHTLFDMFIRRVGGWMFPREAVRGRKVTRYMPAPASSVRGDSENRSQPQDAGEAIAESAS